MAAHWNNYGDPFFVDISKKIRAPESAKRYGVAVTDVDGDGKFEFVVAVGRGGGGASSTLA